MAPLGEGVIVLGWTINDTEDVRMSCMQVVFEDSLASGGMDADDLDQPVCSNDVTIVEERMRQRNVR